MPATDNFAQGEVVPMPVLPPKGVSRTLPGPFTFRVPIITELVAEFVMLAPKTVAKLALAIVPYPKADELVPFAWFAAPTAVESVALAKFGYPRALDLAWV